VMICPACGTLLASRARKGKKIALDVTLASTRIIRCARPPRHHDGHEQSSRTAQFYQSQY
jgi:hypothetical protein